MRKLILSGISNSAFMLLAIPALAGNPVPVPEDPIVAAPESEWYGSIFAGISDLGSVDTTSGGFPVSVEFDTGYAFGITVGKHVKQNFRIEAELSYASYDATSVTAPTAVAAAGGASGDLNATYLMGNLWYDIPTQNSFSPYVGGGLGVARVDANTLFGAGPSGYGGGETKFAAQLGAGVTFALKGKTSLDIGYRFKAVQGVDFPDADGVGTFAGGDVFSHNLQVGLVRQF